MEEGDQADVPSQEIGLVVGEPAQFRFFSSPVRKQDQVGDVLSSWSEGRTGGNRFAGSHVRRRRGRRRTVRAGQIPIARDRVGDVRAVVCQYQERQEMETGIQRTRGGVGSPEAASSERTAMTTPEPLLDEPSQPSRYIVGIDLGTTNSAVSYVDTAQEPWQVQDVFHPTVGRRGTSRIS